MGSHRLVVGWRGGNEYEIGQLIGGTGWEFPTVSVERNDLPKATNTRT
jgi:hypothetical protein